MVSHAVVKRQGKSSTINLRLSEKLSGIVFAIPLVWGSFAGVCCCFDSWLLCIHYLLQSASDVVHRSAAKQPFGRLVYLRKLVAFAGALVLLFVWVPSLRKVRW